MLKMIPKILIRILLFLVFLEMFFQAGGQVSKGYFLLKNQIKFKSSAEITVLCLGDSISMRGGEYTYPNQLEDYLNQHSEKQFKVINMAHAGEGSSHIVGNIEKWIEDYQPDYVVAMMGLLDSGIKAQEKNRRWFDRLKTVGVVSAILKKKTSEDTVVDSKPKDSDSALGEMVLNEKAMKEAFALMPEAYQKMYLYSFVLEAQKDYIEQEKVLRLLLTAPNQPSVLKSRVYDYFGNNLWIQNRFFDYAKNMKNIAYHSWKSDWVEKICPDKKSREPIVAYLKSRLAKNKSDQSSFDFLMACYLESNDQKNIEQLENLRDVSMGQTVNLTTKKNYLQLLNILQEKGVAVVLVQYPLKDVGLLSNMVKEADIYDQIIFVSNENNFKEALEDGEYKDYFVDRQAANFGHGTKKGNYLIAESVGQGILQGKAAR